MKKIKYIYKNALQILLLNESDKRREKQHLG